MRNEVFVRELHEVEFAFTERVEREIGLRGFKIAPMQREDPRGIDIDMPPKWRHLDAGERKALAGVLRYDNNPRNARTITIEWRK